ncbi:MAG TPA: AarF/ABC1/UbiB kinase family protein [Pyrinomonadaceae bacterium]|jgi:predicted unusual protein kinase regulating ubiquinone biosynthesis (AarF/ABC1/UbiB family)|nr:AarF/ABC1/UbiB kinase family protein [Pyrinomonadaceae bacterium]
MNNDQALIPLTVIPADNGNGTAVAKPAGYQTGTASIKNITAPEPLSDETVAAILKGRGLRGWFRLARVARVLGLFTLYLFLDTYDIRAEFNRRMAERLHEETTPNNLIARLKIRCKNFVSFVFDKSVRLLRLIVFRGREGSESKEARLKTQAVWLSRSLIGLGPTFIKIGQALGTRADLLPLAYVKELSTLQDQVPAFATAEAFSRIEAELGRSLQECYAEIDSEPVASASLGQVYRARLATGEEVAVKVQRPDLEQIISFDVAILYRIVKLINRFFPRANENADWEGMLREFHSTIFEEMDYVKEGRNADRFRYNFRTWQVVRVPKIYWSHTSRRVLTLEFIRGTKVTDVEGLRARRVSAVKVNRLLVRTYLKQLLEDGFFHADPHPGNLLVLDTGHLAFFDFGMVGRITPRLQSQMIDAFFHVVARDVYGLGQDIINLNFLKPGVDPETVRPVVEKLFSVYLNLKLGEVKFKELTYDLAEVIYEYPFRLPANFTYIMRALMTLEGIGIVTDPEFSFFETAKPYAKEFMLRREGKAFRKLIFDKIAGRENGNGSIEWSRVWKLTKMAAQMYLQG